MRRLVRAVGLLLLGLVLLVVLATAGVWLNAQRLLALRYDNPVAAITVAGTPAQVARGQYLVASFGGCTGCHASDPSRQPPVLDGALVEDMTPIATLYAPNLTPGGPLKDWSDGEIIRAIREGLSRDGRALLLMPSEQYRHLSDADVQAIVAYLRAQPAAPGEAPPPSLTLLGTALVGTGVFPLSNQPPSSEIDAPAPGPTPEYGRYLAEISGCSRCHGLALDGQHVAPGPPQGPSLRVVKGWTEEQFFQTLRQGVDPAGRRLSDAMPWRQYGQGSDEDLRALYRYLQSLP